MKVLFIGNSYTYYNDMPLLFEALACENGKAVTVYSVTKGGRKLFEYADNADEYTDKINALVKEHFFDVCFLQEQSILPITDYEKFKYGIDRVSDMVKNSVTKFVLYSTWGRKDGSDTLDDLGLTNKSMTDAIQKAYTDAASHINAAVSFVGASFFDVYSSHKEIELYDKDLTHPSYKGSCLAAITHYKTIFGELPEKCDSLSLTSTELEIFKTEVKKHV